MVAPTATPSYHSSLITPHFQIPYGEAILSLITYHFSLFLAFTLRGRGTTLVVDEVFLNTNKYSTDDQPYRLGESNIREE